MEDRALMIRRQMEVTKRSLTQKLSTLEQQVSDKVQSAGTAVNATAEAVQDAVHSVGNAFDLERQFRRHPWLFLGGSVVLGYIATELLSSTQSPPQKQQLALDNTGAAQNGMAQGLNGHPEAEQAGNHIEVPMGASTVNGSANTGGSMIGIEIRRAASGAFAGIVQELVARSVPLVMGYFHPDSAPEQHIQERRSDTVKPKGV